MKELTVLGLTSIGNDSWLSGCRYVGRDCTRMVLCYFVTDSKGADDDLKQAPYCYWRFVGFCYIVLFSSAATAFGSLIGNASWVEL
ncbi:hypothetical protein V6N13_026404 [Hibiscus sabdariffa]|uniref:Uncharacterized protein n=1 Tax=Hibiscus sabdariffa TaxID=183260 RepID=A0ABR2P6Z5_9ROSI